jgi:hypothetical protein
MSLRHAAGPLGGAPHHQTKGLPVKHVRVVLVGTLTAVALLVSGGTPAARASSAPGGETIHIAVAGTDGALWAGPGRGAPFVNLNGTIDLTPAVGLLQTGTNEFNPFYVAVGQDDALWARTGTALWKHLSAVTTVCVDKPGVFTKSTGSGSTWMTHVWVACVGGDDAVWYADGIVSGDIIPQLNNWRSVGGQVSAGVSIAEVGGQITFLGNGNEAAGTDTVWSRTVATGWVKTVWRCIGTPALAAAYGRAWFACQGADDDALWYAQNSGGSTWSQALSAGGKVTGDPAVAVTLSGATFVVIGTDQGIWQNFKPNAGTPGGWSSDGGKVPEDLGVAAVGTTPPPTNG